MAGISQVSSKHKILLRFYFAELFLVNLIIIYLFCLLTSFIVYQSAAKGK